MSVHCSLAKYNRQSIHRVTETKNNLDAFNVTEKWNNYTLSFRVLYVISWNTHIDTNKRIYIDIFVYIVFKDEQIIYNYDINIKKFLHTYIYQYNAYLSRSLYNKMFLKNFTWQT